MTTPKICLNMIVKNEEHVITKCLSQMKDYIHYYVIVDTGSTDNTILTIKNYFDSVNIPGKVISHTFGNCDCHIYTRDYFHFGLNRSYAIEQCYDSNCDYIWIMDADDYIEGGKVPIHQLSSKRDKYSLILGNPGYTYQRVLIIKNDPSFNFHFNCPLHEYLTHDKPASQETIKGNYYIVSGKSGDRSKDPKRYEKDALIFESLLNEKSGDENRYLYYCGQSYRDANILDKAYHFFKLRTEKKGWDEETFCAYLEMIKIILRQNMKDEKGESREEEFVKLCIDASTSNPKRAEALFYLGKHFYEKNDFKASLIHLLEAKKRKYYPNALFIAKYIYDSQIDHFLSLVYEKLNLNIISSFYSKKVLTKEEMIKPSKEKIQLILPLFYPENWLSKESLAKLNQWYDITFISKNYPLLGKTSQTPLKDVKIIYAENKGKLQIIEKRNLTKVIVDYGVEKMTPINSSVLIVDDWDGTTPPTFKEINITVPLRIIDIPNWILDQPISDPFLAAEVKAKNGEYDSSLVETSPGMAKLKIDNLISEEKYLEAYSLAFNTHLLFPYSNEMKNDGRAVEERLALSNNSPPPLKGSSADAIGVYILGQNSTGWNTFYSSNTDIENYNFVESSLESEQDFLLILPDCVFLPDNKILTSALQLMEKFPNCSQVYFQKDPPNGFSFSPSLMRVKALKQCGKFISIAEHTKLLNSNGWGVASIGVDVYVRLTTPQIKTKEEDTILFTTRQITTKYNFFKRLNLTHNFSVFRPIFKPPTTILTPVQIKDLNKLEAFRQFFDLYKDKKVLVVSDSVDLSSIQNKQELFDQLSINEWINLDPENLNILSSRAFVVYSSGQFPKSVKNVKIDISFFSDVKETDEEIDLKSLPERKGFKFYPCCDIYGFDIRRDTELKELEDCKSFNTLGYIKSNNDKSKLEPLKMSESIKDGIFIRV